MQIWRYVSLLIGTPEQLLFEGNEVVTREFNRTAMMCEPPPSEESVAVAGALVHGLPDIAGATDPKAARRFSRNIYRVARALLGYETADRLQFPRMYTLGLLPAMRLHRMILDRPGSWCRKSPTAVSATTSRFCWKFPAASTSITVCPSGCTLSRMNRGEPPNHAVPSLRFSRSAPA